MRNPSPPMPDMFGSATLSAAAVAIAASTASPPRGSALIPARRAAGWPAQTTPRRARTTGGVAGDERRWRRGEAGAAGAAGAGGRVAVIVAGIVHHGRPLRAGGPPARRDPDG